MIGQCHRSYQHEFDQSLGGSGRQEGPACSGLWGHEEWDMTYRRNNNKKDIMLAAHLLTHCSHTHTSSKTIGENIFSHTTIIAQLQELFHLSRFCLTFHFEAAEEIL